MLLIIMHVTLKMLVACKFYAVQIYVKYSHDVGIC